MPVTKRTIYFNWKNHVNEWIFHWFKNFFENCSHVVVKTSFIYYKSAILEDLVETFF